MNRKKEMMGKGECLKTAVTVPFTAAIVADLDQGADHDD